MIKLGWANAIGGDRKDALWILCQARDMVEAAGRYANAELIAACRQRGVRVRLVKPSAVDLNTITQRNAPKWVMNRSGNRTAPAGKRLLGHLDVMGTLCLPGAVTIETATHKGHAAAALEAARVATPPTLALNGPRDVERVVDTFGFPMVVKPASEAKGRGVVLCRSRQALRALLAETGSVRGGYVAQPLVAGTWGRDVRVMVIAGRAVGAMLRESVCGDFRSNVALGGRASKLPLTAELASLAERAARALSLPLAGVDILLAKSGPMVCEVNTSPGFEAFDAASGGRMADTIIAALASGAMAEALHLESAVQPRPAPQSVALNVAGSAPATPIGPVISAPRMLDRAAA